MFDKYLESKKKIINSYLQKYLNEITTHPIIKEGMIYSVMQGGKRIRPILLLMTLELFNKNIEIGMPIACALEMIHSFSLVHDDLPSFDNDDYRRGKLSTHKKYGEAQGILIGDALLIHSFYVMTKYCDNKKFDSSILLEIIKKISLEAGVNGLITGQQCDLENENKKINLEDLKNIHLHKTGKLFSLPIEIGAILSNATLSQTQLLLKYSNLIGLAFQIKDDILDVEGDFKLTGKSSGIDEKNNKTTYVSLLGLEGAKKALDNTVEESIKIMNGNFKEANNFIKLSNYIKKREM